MRLLDLTLPAAIAIAGLALAGAYAASNRYTTANADNAGSVWKTDQWTGDSFVCGVANNGLACVGPARQIPPGNQTTK